VFNFSTLHDIQTSGNKKALTIQVLEHTLIYEKASKIKLQRIKALTSRWNASVTVLEAAEAR
jgi:hypothetical protein